MEGQNIYDTIAARTGGDIYIGVVGPVRTGKSDLTTRLWILQERPLCRGLLTPICIFQET